MRLMIGVFIGLGLLIGAGFWMNDWLLDSSVRLVQQIEVVHEQIECGNWAEASFQVDELERKWDKEAKWWPVFLEHQEMDNIEFSLARCKEYVSRRDDALSMGQLAETRVMIEHIPRKEEITLENIL